MWHMQAKRVLPKSSAEYIKMISTEEVALYDAAAGGEVNIDEYDIVIMGGSIRIRTYG